MPDSLRSLPVTACPTTAAEGEQVVNRHKSMVDTVNITSLHHHHVDDAVKQETRQRGCAEKVYGGVASSRLIIEEEG